jgi:hypothetical protein
MEVQAKRQASSVVWGSKMKRDVYFGTGIQLVPRAEIVKLDWVEMNFISSHE